MCCFPKNRAAFDHGRDPCANGYEPLELLAAEEETGTDWFPESYAQYFAQLILKEGGTKEDPWRWPYGHYFEDYSFVSKDAQLVAYSVLWGIGNLLLD